MKTKLENSFLTLYLEGRIDSGNASQLEQEVMAAVEEAKDAAYMLDAEKLEYISSAGLRVLMKLIKRSKEKLSVYNVSPEVYEILETTGFTDLLQVHKALRKISVEGCELLGDGGNGSVYRIDEDKIVKVYKPWMKEDAINRERSFARTAFVNGIPSVIAYDMVKVGNCLGIVFEALNSDTLGHVMRDHPEKLEEYTDKYVALAKTLHSTHVPVESFTRIQEVCHGYIDHLGKWCSKEETELLHGITDSIPNADTVTHNDLHPGNIMLQDGELVLIDMPQVTLGPPIVDLVAIYRDMISAPTASAGAIEHSIGMPAELILKTGKLFFAKYTGISDPAEMEGYFKKLGLLYAFNVVLIPGSGSEKAMAKADGIMERLLRAVVIPNEQAIKGLFRTL